MDLKELQLRLEFFFRKTNQSNILVHHLRFHIYAIIFPIKSILLSEVRNMYKLLSHNDLDGVGCGILAKIAFGKEVKVRYNSIASLNREVEWFFENENKDTFLFITDLSVNEENEKRLEAFYQAGGKVQFLDHHKTSLHFNEYEWGHVVVEDTQGNLTSATSLFYDYLVEHQLLEASESVAEFVELVRQYDTWEWEKNENQKARKLNALFFLVSIEEFEEVMIERLQKSEQFYFDDFEMKILHMEGGKIERYIRQKNDRSCKRSLVTILLELYMRSPTTRNLEMS